MEAIGSEVGQKMRSAIKAKLMELGCYVDDELPDYVMVMVANKRTRCQMEEDLQLFLTNNTEAFVGWLHQVLQKLQEVTINTSLVTNSKKSKQKRPIDSSSLKKLRKEKEKKKGKLKDKPKLKAKKSKKDKKSSSKETERIRPNIPPLLMNLEKEPPPSITDIFAGQILKTHGIKSNSLVTVDDTNNFSVLQANDIDKPSRKLLKRNRFPIIDPNSVTLVSNSCGEASSIENAFDVPSFAELETVNPMAVLTGEPRAKKIKEMNEITAKIQTLKKKLVGQIESGSEDEDFINLRTETEELMGVDFNEENSTLRPVEIKTPPIQSVDTVEKVNDNESYTPAKSPIKHRELITAPIPSPSPAPSELPLIELNLPKRPLRDRLGVRPNLAKAFGGETSVTRMVNMVNPYPSSKEQSESKQLASSDKISIKSRLTLREEKERVSTKESNTFNKDEPVVKRRIGSRVVPVALLPNGEEEAVVAVASVVRAPPRPPHMSGAPASQLLMRAVADAHKSLLSMPPKSSADNQSKKKALVLPMRRNNAPKKIVIQVSSDNVPAANSYERRNSNSDFELDIDTESLEDLESDGDCRKRLQGRMENANEYVPEPLGKKMVNFKGVDYVPTHIEMNNRPENKDASAHCRILLFKNEKSESGKDPQFVVTLDGLDPNIFLEKKMVKENQEDKKKETLAKMNDSQNNEDKQKQEVSNELNGSDNSHDQKAKENPLHRTNIKISLSNLSNKNSIHKTESLEKSVNEPSSKSSSSPENSKAGNNSNLEHETKTKDLGKAPGTKRKIDEVTTFNHKDSFSPIVFHSDSKAKGEEKDASPGIGTSKYDSLPSLPPDKKRKQAPLSREPMCRFFPDCRLGSACEFYHPPSSPLTPQPSPAAVSPACRAFPNCLFGESCAYGHPMCKFDSSCTRKGCIYTHSIGLMTKTKLVNQASVVTPVVASRVVAASNYKSISAAPLPAICKFYPNCSNPSCNFFHPKPCRFGKFCRNKIECNFFHHDMPAAGKWSS